MTPRINFSHHYRKMISAVGWESSPSLGITATANANDQVIIEGSNESLIYLAEIILERCK